jgi:TonB family protein
MIHKVHTATFILIVGVFGAVQANSQTIEPSQAAASAPTPAPAQRIVTKDPEYLKLLNPPQGNEFLQTYSKAYRDKSVETDSQVAGISDENLRGQARNNAWASVLKNDEDKFRYEAEVTFREAKISFSRRHRDGWIEVGRVAYDEVNSVLATIPNSTTPIDAALRLPMKVATLNQVYAKFHEIAGQEIDQKTHEYVARARIGSNCSRNPDWCYQYAKEDIERSLRSARLVVVAQGDLESMKMDHLLLVDYDTEAVLFELDAQFQGLSSAAWRFSVGPVPTAPVEHASAEAQPQTTAAAPAEPGPSPSQTTEGAKRGDSGEPESDSTGFSKTSTARVVVPANVTAASILSQSKPEYPPQARARRIQGEVVLHAIIDKEGKVSEAHVLSGDETLAPSAIEAVRQWRYKPMAVDGQPKEVDTTITIMFSLQE